MSWSLKKCSLAECRVYIIFYRHIAVIMKYTYQLNRFFFNDQSNIFKTNRLNIKIYWSGTDQCSRVLRIKHGSHILSIFKHHYIAIYLYIYTFLYNHQSIRNNVFIIKIKNNFVFSHKKNKKWSPVYDDKESIKYT